MLYVDHGWSANEIAKASGFKRWAIQNALRRRGVQLVRGHVHSTYWLQRRKALDPWFPPEAIRAWFNGERAFVDPFPPTKVVQGVLVFRNRRCQCCGEMTHYAVVCPECLEPLDPGQRTA